MSSAASFSARTVRGIREDVAVGTSSTAPQVIANAMAYRTTSSTNRSAMTPLPAR